MKLSKLLTSAALGVAALVMTVPAANAATAQKHAPTVHRVVTMQVSPITLHVKAPGLVKCNPCTISPRTACGGFNGHVQWGNSGISVWGELWDTCGATSSLWVSYNDLDSAFNEDIQDVKNGTTGLNWHQIALFPGQIGIAVCNTHGGWHCGATTHV
jgi:hypothetical protein